MPWLADLLDPPSRPPNPTTPPETRRIVGPLALGAFALLAKLVHLAAPSLASLHVLGVGAASIGIVWTLVVARSRSVRRGPAAVVAAVSLASLLINPAGTPSSGIPTHFAQREEVVRLIETGELQVGARADDPYWVEVPPRFRHLTTNGGILVERSADTLYVFFLQESGMFGSGDGYLYRSGEALPAGQWLFQIRPRRVGVATEPPHPGDSSVRNPHPRSQNLPERWSWAHIRGAQTISS